MSLPSIPAPLKDFLLHLETHPDAWEATWPYRQYESRLRGIYAQQPDSEMVADPYVNVVPLFAGHEHLVKTRARNPEEQSVQEHEKYLLPLAPEHRRANDMPAIVGSLNEFRSNFNLFSESSLQDLDWSNIVAAGSAVTTSLLPIPEAHNESKRTVRSYYHQTLAPASDVDLFIYGLDEERAIAKMKEVESKIRDNILSDTTTIRTKHAVTIASQYPVRHVQIVLRLYKSISEILTGFDVDCSCVAFDGKQVWAVPRAVTAFVKQTNLIDLARRSPSYENRLFKYSRRGFEVYWPLLDRSKVDPTIFERSLRRVTGLARLLVYEKLPNPRDRERYLEQRREERGRPGLSWHRLHQKTLPGNTKDAQPDDVADWLESDEVSSYHTLTVPYGPTYKPKRIEKLFFAKDLLLNAEWNRPKDRHTDLHRHPAFFGSLEEAIGDCCGFCPQPITEEEMAIAEEESQTFISGKVTFMKDDPGRQQIGSFYPITDRDWTEMAYVGNTARLCQAIVDHDLHQVNAWCEEEEGADVNRRDHTGRTPLQLACQSGTPEIVQSLVDRGARLVARMVDGFTALHIAAQQGNAEMVRIILEKSESNENDALTKEQRKLAGRRASRNKTKGDPTSTRGAIQEGTPEDGTASEQTGSDSSMQGADDDQDDEQASDSVTEGSFVKVSEPKENEDVLDGEGEDQDDFFQVNVLAWDYPFSPLHLAIIHGHVEVIEMLVSRFGADVLLPVTVLHQYNTSPQGVILALILALQLPTEQAVKTTAKLLNLGATPAQTDTANISALQWVIRAGEIDVLDMYFKLDEPAAKRALGHISVKDDNNYSRVSSPLLDAIEGNHTAIIDKLLDLGVDHTIRFESFVRAFHAVFPKASPDPATMRKKFNARVEQPIVAAAMLDLPNVMLRLLSLGADPNTLLPSGRNYRCPPGVSRKHEQTLLEVVRDRIVQLETEQNEAQGQRASPADLNAEEIYLQGLREGSYRYWLAQGDFLQAKSIRACQIEKFQESLKKHEQGTENLLATVHNKLTEYRNVENAFRERGGRIYQDLQLKDRESEAEPNTLWARSLQWKKKSSKEHPPYKTSHRFMVPDLTDSKTEAYHRLFQAAWEGDLATVKSLSLGSWEEGQEPLQVAVRDHQGFSPFSLAMMQGHLDLAKNIISIAAAQYQPRHKEDRRMFTLDPSRMEVDSSDDGVDPLSLVEELVDKTYTMKEVGGLAETIRCKTSPLELLKWEAGYWRAFCDDKTGPVLAKERLLMTPGVHFDRDFHESLSGDSWGSFHTLFQRTSNSDRCSLLRYIIAKGDVTGFETLMSLFREASKLHQTDRTKDRPWNSWFKAVDYRLAMRLGRTDMLGRLIMETGLNFPIGVVVDAYTMNSTTAQAPRKYLGLTVHGKKRQDWADQRRGVKPQSLEVSQSPLLTAALHGSLESVQYLLGEGSLQQYLGFFHEHRKDPQIKSLIEASVGVDEVIKTWLGASKSLLMHMAVMSMSKADDPGVLLDYLIRNMSENIDARAKSGQTALQLSVRLGHMAAAERLIAAGADQTCRDRKGRNLLHSLLAAFPADVGTVEKCLGLLDPTLVPELLVGRCNQVGVGFLTPLALWLRRPFGSSGPLNPRVLDVILRYSGGADLDIVDGAGDYPFHSVIRSKNFEVIDAIIQYRPSVFVTENAMGQTPTEIINNANYKGLTRNGPAVKPAQKIESARKARIDFWALTQRYQPLVATCKRHLVSVHEANEVAHRLAQAETGKAKEGPSPLWVAEKHYHEYTGVDSDDPRYDPGVYDADGEYVYSGPRSHQHGAHRRDEVMESMAQLERRRRDVAEGGNKVILV